jgi:hypothetical protein
MAARATLQTKELTTRPMLENAMAKYRKYTMDGL